MDQKNTGKFIASLRRSAGLTQESLGERLGVTNKTVSRWENGNYMPDVDMLQMLAKEFGVTVDELLAGERLPDCECHKETNENAAAPKTSAFSLNEQRAYYKRKWRKEHAALFVIMGLILIAAAAIPFAVRKPWLICIVPIVAFLEHCYQYNRMMSYVEKSTDR